MSLRKRQRDDATVLETRPSKLDNGTDEISSIPPTNKAGKSQSKKRYKCDFPGCGLDYSRGEHLERHKLNHQPKRIYKCDFPSCTREFVREDLCSRHQERHSNSHKQESTSSSKKRINSRNQRTSTDRSKLIRQHSGEPLIEETAEASYGKTLPQGQFFDDTTSYEVSKGGSSKTGGRPQKRSKGSSDILGTGEVMNNDPGDYWDQTRNRSMLGQQSPVNQSTQIDPDRNPFNSLSDAPGYSTIQDVIADDTRPDNIADLAYGLTPYEDFGFGDPSASGQEIADLFLDLQTDFYGLDTAEFPSFTDGFGNDVYGEYFADPTLTNTFPAPLIRQTSNLSATQSIDLTSTGVNYLSLTKRQSLLNIMENRFKESQHSTIGDVKEKIFQGNEDADEHVLSLRSMQLYIDSYWRHFHVQLPILHQPTFSGDTTHDYLLLAIICVGASLLPGTYDRNFTHEAARLAYFITWHLRGQVFNDNEFGPPPKLWVIQTLLLVEVYEKMNSTRIHHERAHVHHATTINLLRRGTALIENPDFNISYKDRSLTTPEQWWNQWITTEATRRVALAVFFLDAVHAAMFGHAATMVLHEIRLPLPCDDALWSATSAAEVGRTEASLHANGFKPTTFGEGLTNILTSEKVRTNNFGRMILMAGLLSISWHMNQGDLQITSLPPTQSMVKQLKWREPLSKAFEYWKKDFDESMEDMRQVALPWQRFDRRLLGQPMSDFAAVLYHYSHMSMHADIMDCQIFAGAKRLFGRAVSRADLERVRGRIHTWVKSARARIAFYHAIQILRNVMLPDASGSIKPYQARDDHLLVRPWALYFSALIVWSYGYAIDGPLRPYPFQTAELPLIPSQMPTTFDPMKPYIDQPGATQNLEIVLRDAQSYLQAIGSARSPHELETVKAGRNNVVGILRVLEAAFSVSRWELLHEAADRLREAVKILKG